VVRHAPTGDRVVLVAEPVEVVADCRGRRVTGRIGTLGDGQSPAVARGGLALAVLLVEQGAQAVADQRDLGMVRAEELLLERQRLPVAASSGGGFSAGALTAR